MAPDLADRADENLALHFSWVQRQTPGMRCLEDIGLVLVDSGLPSDTFNSMCRTRLTDANAEQGVAAALAYFRRAGRPFSWWSGPADTPPTLGRLLAAQGLVPAESEVAMAADVGEVVRRHAAAPAPAGYHVERVMTPAALETFARLTAGHWDPPDAAVLAFYRRGAPVLLAPESPLRFFLAFHGNEPAGTAELTVGGNVAGLYNIATLPAHRGRGVGSLLTVAPLVEAQAAGYEVAILQAAETAGTLYQRLGFQAFGRYTEYKLS